MRAVGLAACVSLLAAFSLFPCLPGYAGDGGPEDGGGPLRLTPGIVGVGLGFGGAEVLVEGTVPADTEILVKVSSQPITVRLSKKGRVAGIFWMTTERAIVENMPAFHALYASQPLETLLSKEDQVRIGADGECAAIMGVARVTSDEKPDLMLPAEKAQEYATSLRDLYIKNGRYVPCVSCHRTRSWADGAYPRENADARGAVHLTGREWSLRVALPADAPQGEYDVIAYQVKGGKAIGSDSAKFRVEKTGLAQILGRMATHDAPAYGALSLAVVVLLGLGIGAVFPKGRH